MNTDHFKKLLLARQRELQSTLSALEREGSDVGTPEVRDSIDDANLARDTSDSLAAATILSETLEDVEDALGRVEDGSYGECSVCGGEIGRARLEAIPWTNYCLEDQERIDKGADQGAEPE